MSYYNLDATFRPIESWPGQQTKVRQRARFKAGWSDTLDLLKRELRQLGARHVVVEVALNERNIRLDGYPRANATAEHPGVILSFESRFGPLRYPCDTFNTWEDNIRAIALALEALRKVDRYGVTKRGEQYTGWKKLPGAGGTSDTMTAAAAAKIVSDSAESLYANDELLRDRELVDRLYRTAAKRVHPDVAGGSHDKMAQLTVAKRVLDHHHGNHRQG